MKRSAQNSVKRTCAQENMFNSVPEVKAMHNFTPSQDGICVSRHFMSRTVDSSKMFDEGREYCMLNENIIYTRIVQMFPVFLRLSIVESFEG